MRAFVVVLAVGVVLAAGCKQDNPLFCDESAPCANGGTCNLVTNQCDGVTIDAGPPQPDAPPCGEDSECVESTRPICGAADLCRECDNAVECVTKDPLLPLCADNGACVECTASSECADALSPICRADACAACADDDECAARDAALGKCAGDGQCVECLDHGDCASGVCDRPAGACVAEAAVVYVNGATGADVVGCGTRAAPCDSVGIGLLRVETGRIHVLVTAGDYNEDLIISADTVVVAPGATFRPVMLNRPAVVVNSGASVVIDGAAMRFAQGDSNADGVQCQSSGASVRLVRATLSNNSASGVDVRSGCAAVIEECTVEDNGVIGVFISDASLTLRRSAVRGNDGGGLSLNDSPFTIVNNFVVSNGNGGAGGTQFGGVNVDNSGGTFAPQVFDFNTVADNQSSSSGLASGVYCFTSMMATLRNSIVFDGLGADAIGGNCGWAFSNVEGGVTGAGNINAAPMFVSPAMGNFHLQDGSPAQDIADQASTVTVDVDGDARPTGVGRDMGADEIAPR